MWPRGPDFKPSPLSYHGIFDLGRADPVPADVDDVVEAPRDLVVALLGAPGAVPGEEVTCGDTSQRRRQLVSAASAAGAVSVTGVRLEVGVDESLVVVVDAAGHAGPRLSEAQRSGAGGGRHRAALQPDGSGTFQRRSSRPNRGPILKTCPVSTSLRSLRPPPALRSGRRAFTPGPMQLASELPREKLSS